MVAISLYKGNLHKVPDVPRRWSRPTSNISLKDFKILLLRRSRALARIRSQANVAPASIPNPASNLNPHNSGPDPIPKGDYFDKNHDGDHSDKDNPSAGPELPPQEDLKDVGGAKDVEVHQDALMKLVEESDANVEEEEEKKNEETAKIEDKTEVVDNTEVERNKQEVAINDKDKRRKEIEEKLEILNERKHSLVQVLKQILSAEEQLKRQNSIGTSGRPPLPLQVDSTTDTGSMSRANTPKMGSDGIPCGDIDVGEADDVLNNNIHPRHVPHMSSTSPSSDCQQRKPPPNMVPLTHRTSLGVAGSPSPSRFAPAGQVHSSVSVTGTSYIASSPSPAASGGTSVFRDGRLPSPWN